MRNDHRQTNDKASQVTRMLIWAVVVVAALAALGSVGGESLLPASVGTFPLLAAVLGTLATGGVATLFLRNPDERKALEEKHRDLNQLAGSYNLRVKDLRREYDSQRRLATAVFGNGSSLRQRFSLQYEALRKQYDQERRRYLATWYQQHRRHALARRLWGWVLVLGLGTSVLSCSHALVAEGSAQASAKPTAWNAENIPIPHLTDGLRYVSNPDSVLTENSVKIIDRQMRLLDTELGIESTVIVVNHIENDDPFRMAQDVGNRYGIGRDDRGLVIVVGYQDRSINISPGKALEADLTDVECHRLEQRYVVPAMREGEPDSAMIYLAKGLYALMQGKELPVMAESSGRPSESDDEDEALVRHLALITLWLIFALLMESRFEWVGLYATAALMSNPFAETPVYVSTGGGFGGGGGGFGGGGIGGGFGGGSFGGGGATARW